MQEQKRHASALFVTLTYSPDEVPITANGFMTIHKPHVQQFFQTLRDDIRAYCKSESLKAHRRVIPNIVKYYACGEYGSDSDRPHYHAIIFGATAEFIERAWRTSDGVIRGYVHFGDVRGESISYVTKYMMKAGKIPKHKRDDRQPEFQLQSKGIGLNYLTPEIVKYHKDDINRNYVTELGGVKVPMPRYYRDRVYTEEDREAQRILLKQDATNRMLSNFYKHCYTFGLAATFDNQKSRESFIAALESKHRYLIQNSFKDYTLNRKKL